LSYTSLLRSVIGNARRTDGAFVIHGANLVWPNANLKLDLHEFDFINETLKVPIRPVVFPQPGVNEINAEIERTTEGLIKNLLNESSVDAQTSFILTNAIYFKGQWQHPFEAKSTHEALFTLLDGTTKPVKLMSQ
jgi:serpin B